MVKRVLHLDVSTLWVVFSIGEIGRTLKVRMVEHKRAVKSKDPLNGIAVHVQKTAHNIN